MDTLIFNAFVLLVCCAQIQSKSPSYSIRLEESLRTELFTNYDVQQRPSKKVVVSVGFTILTINELNIKDQTLSVSGYLTVEWVDWRLTWLNTSSTSHVYSSINFLFATGEYLWRPAIIIENAIDGISVIDDRVVPMRITQDGRVSWNPAGVYKVSCESNTKFYPMDTQSCYIKVSGWAYTSTEIVLIFNVNAIDKSFYSENGEWDLLTADAYKSDLSPKDGKRFSTLSFLIKLQRRLLFHIVNTLFPIALIAILIPFVFKLPLDSGEKVGFSLTVLLSYAVYLTLISDNIPSTSVTVCYLSLYLAFILFMATIAVCCTTLVINLYMRTDDEAMPDWLKNLTFNYLVKIACWKNSCFCRRNKVKDKCSTTQNHMTNGILATDYTEKDHPESAIIDKSHDLTWKELSEIMDKVFYNIYMFLIIVSTFILFFAIIAGYYSAS